MVTWVIKRFWVTWVIKAASWLSTPFAHNCYFHRRGCLWLKAGHGRVIQLPYICSIAAHVYCSQDLVNLLLNGHAVTKCSYESRDTPAELCNKSTATSTIGTPVLVWVAWLHATWQVCALASELLPFLSLCTLLEYVQVDRYAHYIIMMQWFW